MAMVSGHAGHSGHAGCSGHGHAGPSRPNAHSRTIATTPLTPSTSPENHTPAPSTASASSIFDQYCCYDTDCTGCSLPHPPAKETPCADACYDPACVECDDPECEPNWCPPDCTIEEFVSTDSLCLERENGGATPNAYNVFPPPIAG